MNFGDALKALKEGQKLFRLGWATKYQFLSCKRDVDLLIQIPETAKKPRPGDVISQATRICMTLNSGLEIPWKFSQSDILATDWQLILEKQQKEDNMKDYIVIDTSIDGVSIAEKSKEEIVESLCQEMKDGRKVKIMTTIPQDPNPKYWEVGRLIIKGEIVVPKEKKVVVEYDF